MQIANGFDLNKTLITTPYLEYAQEVDADICQRWIKTQETPGLDDQKAVDRFEEIVEEGFVSGDMPVYATENAVETIQALREQGHRIFVYSTCTANATAAALENAGFSGIEPLSTFDYQEGKTDAKTADGLRAVAAHLGMPVATYADDKLSDLQSARVAFGGDTKLYHIGGTNDDKETGTIAIATLDQILKVNESRL